MITVFIEYRIDPFQSSSYEEYARKWLSIIPTCGGDCVGYFMPYEGTNDIAYGIIRFRNLAEYETYRSRLKEDVAGRENFEFAIRQKFIHRETRTFLREVME